MADELTGTTTVEEDVVLLEGDEKPSRDEELVEAPDGEDKLGDGDEEAEEESEEGAKSEEEPVTYYDRPSVKQIKEKYPDFFKTFPQIRDMYFRESEFSKVFPTVDDAREAASSAESFVTLRDAALNGDAKTILTAVGEADPKALHKMAGNLLSNLYDISKDAHWEAVAPVLQNVVQSFYNEGKTTNNTDLTNAALHLSKFLFNNFDVAKGKSVVKSQSPEATEELKKIEDERNKLFAEKLTGFTNSVYTEGGDGLLGLIGADRKIDPEGNLTKGMKDYVINKVIEEVNQQMQSDPEHVRMMQSLWTKAKREGFGDTWKSRLVTAYLARAKSLVPGVRAKYVSEILGTSVKSSDKTRTKVEHQNGRVEPGQSGLAAKDRPVKFSAKEIDWSKTSDLDFINDNVSLKRK
jgi:hypothetical protein